MNGLFEEKYDELFTEFNYYVAEHPESSERIPHDALVVLLDKNDPVLNRENLRRVKDYLLYDNVPGRAVVYIQIGRLAPVRSRSLNDTKVRMRIPCSRPPARPTSTGWRT